MAESRRRTFGPVVLLGLASAGLAAVAGSRDWVEPDAQAPEAFGWTPTTAQMPLAAALSLVLLACWGVLLVTRGWFRRSVAVLALLAALGLLATTVVGWSVTADSLRDVLEESAGEGAVHHTTWYWCALVAAAVSVLACAAAVRLVPTWPEMGSRYDAPGAAPTHAQTDLDLWRALDDGRDPTLTDRERGER